MYCSLCCSACCSACCSVCYIQHRQQNQQPLLTIYILHPIFTIYSLHPIFTMYPLPHIVLMYLLHPIFTKYLLHPIFTKYVMHPIFTMYTSHDKFTVYTLRCITHSHPIFPSHIQYAPIFTKYLLHNKFSLSQCTRCVPYSQCILVASHIHHVPISTCCITNSDYRALSSARRHKVTSILSVCVAGCVEVYVAVCVAVCARRDRYCQGVLRCMLQCVL